MKSLKFVSCLSRLLKSLILSKPIVVALFGWMWVTIPGIFIYYYTVVLFLQQQYLIAIVFLVLDVVGIVWTVKVSKALPRTLKDYYRTKKIFQVRGVRKAIIREYEQCNDALCTIVALALFKIEFGTLD